MNELMINKKFGILCLFFLIFNPFSSFSNKEKWDSDKSTWTAFMKATYKGNHKKMIKLISKGCDVDSCSKNGNTALTIAIRKQDTIAIRIILDTKKVIISDYSDLIRFACTKSNVPIIKMLKDYGFPLNVNNTKTAVMKSACDWATVEVVEYLISIGFTVNIQRDIDGMTPLISSVSIGSYDKVKLLLKHGADKNAVDKNGKKAIDYLDNIPPRYNVTEETKKSIRKLLE
ncbi:MAG: ankyrin repeat domain-containing protein [Bacteroidota bacterium]